MATHKFTPMRTNINEQKHTRDVITNTNWNELFNLLATQGNHSENELQALSTYLFGTAGFSDTDSGVLLDALSRLAQYITLLTNHTTDVQNPHHVNKTQIGLGNVDNTSDLNKPISNATKTYIDLHKNNFNNPHNVDKAILGLGNVDNTSDTAKPISDATQAALDLKADKATIGNGIYSVEWTASTGVMVFKDKDGNVKKTIDLNIEKIPVSIALEKRNNVYYLVITNTDGTKTECPVSTLFNPVTFENADDKDVVFDVVTAADGSKTVQAHTKAGSITPEMLSPEVLEALINYTAAAQGAAEEAGSSAESAAASAGSAEDTLEEITEKADEVLPQLDLSSQYARGKKLDGTDVISGEAGYHDNSKYYSDAAAESASDSEGFATAAGTAKSGAEEAKSDAESARDTTASLKLVTEGTTYGTQNGVPVGADSPYYHNNASYFYNQGAQRVFTNLSVTWASDTTYQDYGFTYKGTINITGVDSSKAAFVGLNVADTMSGNYSNITQTDTNKVYVYAKVNSLTTIPSVIIWG